MLGHISERHTRGFLGRALRQVARGNELRARDRRRQHWHPRSLPAGAKQSQLVRRVRSWLWWRRDSVASAVLGCARGSAAHGPPPCLPGGGLSQIAPASWRAPQGCLWLQVAALCLPMPLVPPACGTAWFSKARVVRPDSSRSVSGALTRGYRSTFVRVRAAVAQQK